MCVWWFLSRGAVACFISVQSMRSNVGMVIACESAFRSPGILRKSFRSYYGQFYLASIRKAVRRMVEDFSPEIIFACWAHPDGWAAVRIARDLGVPAVIKVIGSDVLVLGRRGRRRQVLAQTLRAADGVVAVSRDLAEHVIELGVDARKVHVVPEGIDVDLFSPEINWPQGPRSACRWMRKWCFSSEIFYSARERAC